MNRILQHHRTGLSLLALAVLVSLPGCGQIAADSSQNPALNQLTRQWRDHPIWYDGKAECAVYDATRTIYGKERHYQTRIYANKEPLDPATRTKTGDYDNPANIEVFKFHVREDIETENYNYHYSTMAYVETDTLIPRKLDMGSIEDCGATFKQFYHAPADGSLQWHQFSYFPDQGHQLEQIDAPANLAFHNALGLILRGYPFEQPTDLPLQLVTDQTWTHQTPGQPRPAVANYVGRETLDLPAGSLEAHHVRVTVEGLDAPQDYWFAADPDTQNILVQYQGTDPAGNAVTFRLREVERRAYWER